MYAEAGLQLPAFSQCFLEEVAGGGFHVGIADGGLDLVSLLPGKNASVSSRKHPKVLVLRD